MAVMMAEALTVATACMSAAAKAADDGVGRRAASATCSHTHRPQCTLAHHAQRHHVSTWPCGNGRAAGEHT